MSNAASEVDEENWKHLRLAIVSALLFLAPIALASPTLLDLSLTWAALLIVFAALLRLFGLRSVLEVTVIVFVLSLCVAAVLLIQSRQAVQQVEQRESTPEPRIAPTRTTPEFIGP